MTSIMSSDFHFFVPESFHKNLVHIGKVVSEKIRFEFLYVQDLGPRASNDLDLQYSHTFIYSIRRDVPVGVPLDLSTVEWHELPKYNGIQVSQLI